MNHSELLGVVSALARSRRLHVHACNDRSCQRGWPDLVVVGPGGIQYAELKIPPDQLRPEQRALGYKIQASGGRWSVWTPDGLHDGTITDALERISHALPIA
jgi:hypothetical protein